MTDLSVLISNITISSLVLVYGFTLHYIFNIRPTISFLVLVVGLLHYITTLYSGLSKSDFKDHYGDATKGQCLGMTAEINVFSTSCEMPCTQHMCCVWVFIWVPFLWSYAILIKYKRLIRRWDTWMWHRSILLPVLCLVPEMEGFPSDDLRKIMHGGRRMAKVQNGEEIL